MMQTANIHALLAHQPNPGEAPDEVVKAAVQEAFALLITVLNNVDRIAAAVEHIALNTHPGAN